MQAQGPCSETFESKPFQYGDRLDTSESDVCGRQILTYEDGPRTGRSKNIYYGRRPIT